MIASNRFWRWTIYSTPLGTQYSTVSTFWQSAHNTLYQDITVRNNLHASKGSVSTAQLYIFHTNIRLEMSNAYRSTRTTCNCSRLLTTGATVTHSIGHTQVLLRSAATPSEVDSCHTVTTSIQDNKIISRQFHTLSTITVKSHTDNNWFLVTAYLGMHSQRGELRRTQYSS